MINSLSNVSFIAFAAAAELSEELNAYMQLVPFPGECRVKLLYIMIFDFGANWVVEYITWYFLATTNPSLV